MRFNTFDEVAKWYADTKPVVSKNHTLADDVRPIGDRRYKWARIIKVDDNTYALTDGSWSEISFNGSHTDDRQINRQTAPILWERKPDGEYMSIRGSMGSGYSVSRYQFYNRYLPRGMYHVDNARQGEHWIEGFGHKHVLPRTVYRYDWNNRKILQYEDKSLVFKREGDKFVRVGSVEIKGKRIDTERKAQVKPVLQKFYEWMSTIAPLVARDYSSRHEYAKLMEEHGVTESPWTALHLRGFDGDKMMEVLTNEEHPCRVALASLLLGNMEYTSTAPTNHAGHNTRVKDESSSYGYRWEYIEGKPFTEEDTAAWYKREAKRVRAAYNRNMNRLLDLFATETV